MSRNESMTFKNPTQHTLNLSAVGLDSVDPGAEVEIPLELCVPGRGDSGARTPSAIENIAPQLVPVSEVDAKIWKGVPPLLKPVSKIVSVAARAKEEAPGVKALRESREKAIAEATAKNPKTPEKVTG